MSLRRIGGYALILIVGALIQTFIRSGQPATGVEQLVSMVSFLTGAAFAAYASTYRRLP